MELTVLGCSGSFGGANSNACSGYLVRSGATAVWVDCGGGSFGNLQSHINPEELTAVVLTHEHPDHVADIYGLHVLMRYGICCSNFPVYAPAALPEQLGALVHNDWSDTFDWRTIDDGQTVELGDLVLTFSRTDHPPLTYAVQIEGDGRRMIYTSDTGPKWSVGAFDPGADLVLSEATYLHGAKLSDMHLSAHEAGDAARTAGAKRLMITHLWPRVDAGKAVAEAEKSFGAPVEFATTNLVTTV